MKKIISIITLFVSLFSSCVSPGPTQNELLVDGKYRWQGEQKTVEKLMEYVQAGDADTIYQVFSQTARERSDNLREKIEEFITFVNEEMVSWEYLYGGIEGGRSREEGVRKERSMEFYIYTDKTRYHCSICEVRTDDFNTNNEGFSSITVIPVGWHDDEHGLFDMRMYVCAYGNFEEDGMGLFLSYPGETREEGTLERLLDLAANQDSGGIYDLYSDYAKETVPDLPEQAEALVEFLQRPIRSWEFYDCAHSCVTEWVQLPGTEAPLLRRLTMFTLHTDEETYTLLIRDLLDGSETGENLGLYSVAIYTDAYSGNCKTMGWFNPGVFIYQLTISGKMEQEDTVLLTTTIEADVACDVDSVVLRQIDALTWEATLPPDGPDSYLFTAEAGVEHVYCYVTPRLSEKAN